MRLSVCIAVKNRSRIELTSGRVLEPLKRCITSLTWFDKKEHQIEVVIADFGSTDWPLLEWLPEAAKHLTVKVINMSGKFSRGAGLNVAAEAATHENLFFCDADILIEPSFLKIVKEIPHDTVYFPAILYLDETEGASFIPQSDAGYGLVLTTKTKHAQVGGWLEFNSWGGEDDIYFNANKASFKIRRQRTMSLVHMWHPEELRHVNYTKPARADWHQFWRDHNRYFPREDT